LIKIVKPENKVYKEGEVYNNSKCCYNTKKGGAEIKKGRKMGSKWN